MNTNNEYEQWIPVHRVEVGKHLCGKFCGLICSHISHVFQCQPIQWVCMVSIYTNQSHSFNC